MFRALHRTLRGSVRMIAGHQYHSHGQTKSYPGMAGWKKNHGQFVKAKTLNQVPSDVFRTRWIHAWPDIFSESLTCHLEPMRQNTQNRLLPAWAFARIHCHLVLSIVPPAYSPQPDINKWNTRNMASDLRGGEGFDCCSPSRSLQVLGQGDKS